MRNSIKNTLLLFAALSVLVLHTSSCKRYEEGPAFTLRTAKARLVNTWEIEKYMVNGEDITALVLPFFGEHSLELSRDNRYEWNIGGMNEKGKWSFIENRDKVEMLEDGDSIKFSQKIIKLTNNEFWVEGQEDGDNIEVHYKTK
ncbi:MAG: hypothetical protein ACK5CL_03580 [Sphingomonadales bacterium]|jgi:hypothetical protein